MDISSGLGDSLGALSGLVGALIGGGATLLGVRLQQDRETKRRHDEERETLLSVLKALDAELNTLWTSYMAKVGDEIASTEHDSYWQNSWHAATDYFVVYRASAPSLGRIRHDPLRLSIVVAYTKAMGLLESHNTYRELVSEAWQAELDPERQRSIMPNPWHQVELAFPLLQSHQLEVVTAIDEMRALIANSIQNPNTM